MNKLKILVVALAIALSSPAYHLVNQPTAYAQFRASSVTTEDAYSQIRRQGVATKAFLTSNRALMVAATVNATVPLAVISHLSTVVPRLDLLATTPGLPQYAKDQHADQAYNVVAQYTTMRDLMVSVMQNLITMFPKDGSGFLLYEQLSVAGVKTTRTFTAAQVSTAVTAIDALIAAIQ